MSYSFTKLNDELKRVEDWLSGEYLTIRTGRASPALLDSVLVEQYGSRGKISHVASISVENPKTLRVTPWDKSMIKSIESGIMAANLGVTVNAQGDYVRVSFPDLTFERRLMLTKLAKEKMEAARVSVRKEREESWNDIVAKEKEGTLSEDDKFRLKDELQKIVDSVNTKLEEMLAHKEKDIVQ